MLASYMLSGNVLAHVAALACWAHLVFVLDVLDVTE